MSPFVWNLTSCDELKMLPIQSVLVACVLLSGCALAGSFDPLSEALRVSYDLNFETLYNEAKIHLDMENVTTVSSKLESTENLTVYSSSDNCSTIMQTEGIPWNNNNSAMRINDSESYVEINQTLDLSNGFSVSMWIKSYDAGGSSNFECIVLTVDTENGSKLKLKRNNGHNYSLHVEDVEQANFTFDETWEWNMLSFTIHPEGSGKNITLYENGASKSSSISDLPDLPSNGLVTMRLNGGYLGSVDGCDEVEVDEVSLWSRVLNMSEFIALRVQPFDTNCTVNVTVLVDRIQRGTPQEASAAVTELVIVVSNSDNEDGLTQDTAEKVDDALEAMKIKKLLTDEALDDETRQGNREAFIILTSAVLDAATKDEDISQTVQDKNVIKRMDQVMKAVYFSENFPAENETIRAPFITTKYLYIDQETDDNGLALEEDTVKFTIPKSVLGAEKPKIILTIFNDSLSSFLASTIGDTPIADRIVSLQLGNVGSEFEDPITLVIPNAGKNNAEKLKNSTAICTYLDLEEKEWKTDGITTKEYKEGDEDLTCYLTHLTNFAVLLSPNELERDETLEALTYVLLAISIICLIITLVVLMCLREIANTQRVQILKHFIFALLMSQLLFVFTTDLVKNKTLCAIFASILHYFWLATFTWMLVQGIQLYTKVRRLVGGNIKQLFYVLFAWGFPLPIATLPLAIFSDKYFEQSICWIPHDLIWFFAVPVVLIFCVNLGVTVLVMKTFLTVKVNKDKSDAEKLKSSMRAVVVMVPVLGLTWAFGFFLLIDQNKLFQYLFVILNTTQGVFVFLFHLVMNEDVRSAVLRRRNKVAANAENTIFTKLPRNKSEHSGGTGTETSKAPLHSDSTTNM